MFDIERKYFSAGDCKVDAILPNLSSPRVGVNVFFISIPTMCRDGYKYVDILSWEKLEEIHLWELNSIRDIVKDKHAQHSLLEQCYQQA